MFPASVGFGSSAVAQHSPINKPETPEQNFQAAEQPAEAPQAAAQPKEADAVPAVPATNSAPLSVEAVTALQQVQEEQATTNRRDVGAAAVQQNEAVFQEQQVVAEAVEAPQNPEQARQENSAEQARVDARGDVPEGEQTDNAGRSSRNPLDLQI